MQKIMNEIESVLLSKEQIDARVKVLARRISEDYMNVADDQKLLVVGMLNGSFIFIADLVREIDLHCEIDFMSASSYGNDTVSSGTVVVKKDIGSIEGQHVLIVEDIVDSGYTMDYIMKLLRSRHPASVRLCTLLDKKSRRVVPVDIDYCGFQVPDEFLVGYGLDYASKFRNLPYIGVLKPEIYTKPSK